MLSVAFPSANTNRVVISNTTAVTDFFLSWGTRTQTGLVRKTPGVVGGKARIRDTRIPVWTLVRLRQLGADDQTLRGYFTVPLTAEDLSAAWDYYDRNREEIEQAIRENEAE